MSPPAAGSSTERDLGRLLEAVNNLASTAKEDREEGRGRDRKLDKIEEGLKDVAEKLRDQSRAATDQESRFNASIRDVKHAAANNSQVLTGQLDLVNVHINKLEAQLASNTNKMTDLATEQTKIRAEVAEVKSDTEKLQAPVSQLVGIRRAVIAWGGGLIVVTGYLFWLFRAAWDDLIHHFMTSVGVK